MVAEAVSLGLQGFNPFLNPLKDIDVKESKKARQAQQVKAQSPASSDGWGFEGLELNMKSNTSFLREGALGEKDALYVKGGRAGCCTNFIA